MINVDALIQKNNLVKKCYLCDKYKSVEEFRKGRNQCRDCVKERGRKNYIEKKDNYIARAKKWAEGNPEKRREIARNWVYRNKEKLGATARDWYSNNKERSKENLRIWRKNHPEQVRIQKINRRAIERNAVGEITLREWVDLRERFGNICLCCRRDDVIITLDHVVPLILGGANEISNVQPLCGSCNSKKGSKDTDYRKSYNV
jgi:5-methylcytosine-specific restriction endonuclease McrA